MVLRRFVAVGSAVALVATLATVGGGAASAAPPGDHRGYVEVPDSAYTLQPGDVDLGKKQDDPIRFEGALKVRNQAEAEALATAVSDPANAAYGQFLRPAEYRRRFAPTDFAANLITTWQTAAGMRITYNPANHLLIASEGSVRAADRAFQTDFHRIQDVDGFVFDAPLTPMFVPAAILPFVDGFLEGPGQPAALSQPLHRRDGDLAKSDRTRASAHQTPSFAPADSVAAPPSDGFRNARPCSTYWAEKAATEVPPLTDDYAAPAPYAPCGYKPAQLQGAYGVQSLLDGGVNGRGVTVAIVDAYASPTIRADINQYAARNGGAPWALGQFKQHKPDAIRFGFSDPAGGNGGNLCDEQGWYGEETLDVEAVHTMAPRANVLYVGAASCVDNDILNAVNDIVDRHQADIISNSYGDLGEDVDPVEVRAETAVYIQAALEGIGVFFSSGDSGDEVDTTGVRQTDFPASDPWVTAVGGTSLAVGPSNNYLFETGWGTTRSIVTGGAWTPPLPGLHLYGAGGGTSQLFAQPSYQQGVVPDEIANYFPTGPGRAVPDIAAVGDPTTGMLVGQTQTFPDGVYYDQYRIGGTSLSAPLMAGMEALADQAAGHPHGFANPAIYRLRAQAVRDVVDPAQTLSAVRVDFVNGTDRADGRTTSLRTFNQTQSIFTRPGYDDVTGVGSPIASVYVNALGKKGGASG